MSFYDFGEDEDEDEEMSEEEELEGEEEPDINDPFYSFDGMKF